MNTKWELEAKSTGKLEVEFSQEEWKKAQQAAFDKLAKNVNIAGFRPGKAPKELIAKQVNQGSVLMEAVEALAPQAYMAGVKEHNLEVVAQPSLDIKELDADKAVVVFTIAVAPTVTLGAYKGLGVKQEEVSVSAEEIDAQLVQAAARNAELVVKTEGTVETGDTAVIDFEGFLNGEAFDGGKGENFPLEIGSGSFIPGFEEQLVGMASGETKEIQVTFPTEYPAENLAGKETTFKVTVHEIKAKHTPELDDELVKELGIEGVETVEAFKKHVEQDILTNKTRANEDAFMNELLGKVVENATVEIPDALVDQEIDRMVQEFASRIQQQGFDLEQFKQMTGQDDEAIRAQMSNDAHAKVNLRLVLEAIAKEEKLEVTEEELNAEYATIAAMYNMEVEKVQSLIPADAIASDMVLRKAVDLIKAAV